MNCAPGIKEESRLPDSAEPRVAEDEDEKKQGKEEEDFRLRASSALSAHVVEKAKEPPDKAEEALWLRNLGSENIWLDKSAVNGAECAHYSKLAKENKRSDKDNMNKKGVRSDGLSCYSACCRKGFSLCYSVTCRNYPALNDATSLYLKDGNTDLSISTDKMEPKAAEEGMSQGPYEQETFWPERAEVLEAEKEYHEKLALRQNCDDGRGRSVAGQEENGEVRWVEYLGRDFVWLDRLEVLEAERAHYTKLAREEARGSKVSPKNKQANEIATNGIYLMQSRASRIRKTNMETIATATREMGRTKRKNHPSETLQITMRAKRLVTLQRGVEK